MGYKAFIFDLDGTLVHTEKEHRKILVGGVLESFGKSFSEEDIERFWFRGNREKFLEERFGLDSAEFWKVYRERDNVELRKKFTKAYDDVGFVAELKKRDFQTGIVTSAPRHIADFEIGLIGREYFDDIVLARPENGIRPKPNPEGIERCLAFLGVSPEEAVYIGNSDEDVLAARQAGVLDALVLRKEHVPPVRARVEVFSLYSLNPLARKD